jgi:hypothetical protein
MQAQLRQEIESLQVELRRSQDPSQMQLIQEMISVRPTHVIFLACNMFY